MQPKRLRPYLEAVKRMGATVEDVTITGSSHYKVKVTAGGNRRFFIVPFSSSDHRSFLNWKCQVRRWVQQQV